MFEGLVAASGLELRVWILRLRMSVFMVSVLSCWGLGFRTSQLAQGYRMFVFP